MPFASLRFTGKWSQVTHRNVDGAGARSFRGKHGRGAPGPCQVFSINEVNDHILWQRICCTLGIWAQNQLLAKLNSELSESGCLLGQEDCREFGSSSFSSPRRRQVAFNQATALNPDAGNGIPSSRGLQVGQNLASNGDSCRCAAHLWAAPNAG